MGVQLRITGAAVALTLLAQAASAQDNAVVLPPIVVSATTVPTPASELGSSVTVVTGDDLQREQLRTVPDMLKKSPDLTSSRPEGRAARLRFSCAGPMRTTSRF